MSTASATSLARAYYVAPVEEFITSDPDFILGRLTANSEASVESEQRNAWQEEISILKTALGGLFGIVYLEFNIPRMGRRIDVVLISESIVFLIEFKVGERQFHRQDLDQVWDYALDLKNFHLASHHAPILPVLVATLANTTDQDLPLPYEDLVYAPARCNSLGLRPIIDLAFQTIPIHSSVDALTWGSAPYHPTPTIIEAAQRLYAHHSVDDIARFDAGARNLRVTSRCLEAIVDESRRQKRKAICFVTGVPGAGKTLVGLNVATKKRDSTQPTHAVFLSGNGPLVAVLREALTRDEVKRRKMAGDHVRKSEVGEKIKAFIQNVHHFRDEGLRDSQAPFDHVVIFDEAQRAWNLEKTASFMQKKKRMSSFSQSEPEFLISYLDRHDDWAVIVCLVGGGQEINTGEAGIGAWIDAISGSFPEWNVYISPHLTDDEYAAGNAIETTWDRSGVTFVPDLHLAVSLRSFRAENVSSFVKAILDCEKDLARQSYSKLQSKYPIAVTRSLVKAREWIRQHARGSERFGLVASSEAQRLKPHAIDVRINVDPVQWFLNDRNDTRSSYYLEDAATEFQVQGLELDWACVTWDGDFRFTGQGWDYHSFWGSGWRKIHKQERRRHLKNAYRVLLTRARQGMVIFVPDGDRLDHTRQPAYYDSTFEYLSEIGIPILQ